MSTLDTFPAFRCERPLDTPLFFYHVPKTGGTTVEAVLYALAAARGRRFQLVPRTIGMRERSGPTDLFDDEATLVYAGHCWFGMHRAAGRTIHLCTVLRDPATRVVSEYLWIASSRGRPASAPDFQHYLDNLAQPNLATRLLAGKADIDWKAIDRAIANLAQFALVGSTANLAPFLSALLTLHGGPTVRTGRAKEQPAPLRSTLTEQFAADIARRNGYDRILYAFAEAELFGRADAILAEHTTPDPRRVRVDNPHGKNFVVTHEAPLDGRQPPPA